MKAKEYLQRLQVTDTFIKQKYKELVDLRAASECAGGFDYSKERVQTSPSGDAPYAKTVMRIIELEKEIEQEIDQYVRKKHLIINEIHGLKSQTHADLLYKRYVEFKSLREIAEEMDYTYQYTRELHRAALKNFESSYTILHPNVLL